MRSGKHDELLDGCSLLQDGDVEWDDHETQLLRPLFPEGRTDDAHEIADRWHELFDGAAAPKLMALTAAPSKVSGKGRDLQLADRMRRTPYDVVECADWKTRGVATLSPKGSVHHHTASRKGSPIPSLGPLLHGRTKPKLAGPLCNIGLSRDNVIYVIASGRANHAGEGTWRGLKGNSLVYGVEWENDGTAGEPMRPDQFEAICWVHAELARGQFEAEMCCQHREWAPRRKIDALMSADAFRARIRELLATEPHPPKEDDMHSGVLMRVEGTKEVWCVTAAGRWFVPATQQPGPPANEWTGTIDLLSITGLVERIPGAANNILVLKPNQRAALEGVPVIPGTPTP